MEQVAAAVAKGSADLLQTRWAQAVRVARDARVVAPEHFLLVVHWQTAWQVSTLHSTGLACCSLFPKSNGLFQTNRESSSV